MPIEFFEGIHSGNWDHETATRKTNAFLHSAFLVTLPGCAVMALKKVVAAEGDKRFLFLPSPSFQNELHGDLQVVVAETSWNAMKVVESVNVPFKECLPPLVREGLGEQLPGVAESHDEQLHGVTGHIL